MEEDCGVSDQSVGITGSGAKVRDFSILVILVLSWPSLLALCITLMFQVIAGEKRGRVRVEERTGLCHKRVKMRDLESVLRTEGSPFFFFLNLELLTLNCR